MSWFRRIFGKADKPAADSPLEQAAPKRISLDEIRAIMLGRLAADDADALRGCSALRSSLVQQIDGLKQAFEALARAPISEPRATASKTIKDGFAQRALTALGRTTIAPFDSVNDIQIGIGELERALSGISAGPREAQHVGFFFEAEMADITVRFRVVFDTAARIRKLLEPAVEKRRATEGALFELESCVRTIADKRKGIKEAQIEIDAAKAKLADVRIYDLAELRRLRDDLARCERAIGDNKQQIAAGISPATKLLKRFGHITGDKHSSELVRVVEDTPANAFLENAEGVKKMLADALGAVRDGEVVADEKEVRRAEDVLGRFDGLLAMRDKIGELGGKRAGLMTAIAQEEVKERENTAMAERIKILEGAIARDEILLVNLQREVGQAEQELEQLRQNLEGCAAAFGERVEIILDK